jgi:hypothetical protein
MKEEGNLSSIFFSSCEAPNRFRRLLTRSSSRAQARLEARGPPLWTLRRAWGKTTRYARTGGRLPSRQSLGQPRRPPAGLHRTPVRLDPGRPGSEEGRACSQTADASGASNMLYDTSMDVSFDDADGAVFGSAGPRASGSSWTTRKRMDPEARAALGADALRVGHAASLQTCLVEGAAATPTAVRRVKPPQPRAARCRSSTHSRPLFPSGPLQPSSRQPASALFHSRPLPLRWLASSEEAKTRKSSCCS